ncbi:hypothetical protein B0T22DRAFT_154836 [Podospora appendiculata]|uniref:Uncharacterized protein n=1 Tax=Podospora appendiculata TaxID=314037 RepID=A0AAE1CCI2_9PEZI|nr:hypothetical protein B0T22DRAFT_154836 [Podospora appendiculata]
MTWFQPLADALAELDTQPDIDDTCTAVLEHIPKSFTLAELAAQAKTAIDSLPSEKKKNKTKSKPTTHQHVLKAITACLRAGDDRIQKALSPAEGDDDPDDVAVLELSRIVAQAMAPIVQSGHARGSDEEEADEMQDYSAVVQHSRDAAAPGIKALALLDARAGLSNHSLANDDEVLVTLAAFTDETDEWVAPEVAEQARSLLEHLLPREAKEQFIANAVLQRFLRPLFSQSKPASVTASGRKAEYPERSGIGEGLPDDTSKTKPWKFTDFRAIAVMSWAVKESDEQLISKHWPLFIPVLLTLVDDSTTRVRRRGLVILADFLTKFPSKTLHDTGLAKVFEEAIFPTLSFLPSLTPEDECVQLLTPAFAALLCLASKQSTAKDTKAKDKLLDKILREGVIMAYFHAKSHVRVVEVLCQQTGLILDQMGIHAVVHLKDLIPMLSGILTDPFAPLSPATLLSAIKALRAVLANCWPRIPQTPWQDEIINGLVLCWLNVVELETKGPQDQLVGEALMHLTKVLAAVLKTRDIKLSNEVAPLVAKQHSLKLLFSE